MGTASAAGRGAEGGDDHRADRAVLTGTINRGDVSGTTTSIGPARIDVPADSDPLSFVWGSMVPGIGPAAAKLSAKVYSDSTLGLEEFEAARLRIAQINQCVICNDWRTARDEETVPEWFADEVGNWRGSVRLSPRAVLAAEYAERFAIDHTGLDEEFWSRMNAEYRPAEVVELTMSIGAWIAFGRLNQVLGLDTACALPAR